MLLKLWAVIVYNILNLQAVNIIAARILIESSCKSCGLLLRDYFSKIFFPSRQELLMTGKVKKEGDILDVLQI